MLLIYQKKMIETVSKIAKQKSITNVSFYTLNAKQINFEKKYDAFII